MGRGLVLASKLNNASKQLYFIRNLPFFNHLLNPFNQYQYLVIWLMLKLILTCFIASIVISTHAQSDFIVLKKRNTSLKTYFVGTYMSLVLSNDELLGGYIKKIQNDTVYIRPFTLQVYLNAFGFATTDTAWSSIVRVAIKNIKGVPNIKRSFEYIRDGSLIEIGAGGYILLNIINNLSHKEPLFGEQNAPRLGTAAGVFAVGLLLQLTRQPYITLGKRYHLDYIRLNSTTQ